MNLLKKIPVEKLLVIYIVLSPIIDGLTSLSVRYSELPLTFGMLIRTILLMIIVFYSFAVMNKKQMITSIIYYTIVFIYLCSYLYFSYSQFGFSNILLQAKGCLKVFSFPILLLALIMIFKNKKILLDNKYFVFSLLIYCLLIIVPYIFGIDFPTYDIGKNEGTIGIFYAGNEIGAILSILSCYLAIELLNNNKESRILNIITAVFTVFCALYLGTKAAFISSMILILVNIIFSVLITVFKDKKYIGRIYASVFVFLVVIMNVGYTPVGRNVGIKPFTITFSNSTSQSQEDKEKKDPEQNADILSGRESFLKRNMQEYEKGNISHKLLGIGYVDKWEGSARERKLAEMDYYDIFLCHGILGVIVYTLPILSVLYIMAINLFKNIRKALFDKNIVITGYGICISLAIAYMAGHTLTSSAVNIFLAITIIKEYNYLLELNVQKLNSSDSKNI